MFTQLLYLQLGWKAFSIGKLQALHSALQTQQLPAWLLAKVL